MRGYGEDVLRVYQGFLWASRSFSAPGSEVGFGLGVHQGFTRFLHRNLAWFFGQGFQLLFSKG